jgi:hypothetical protein
VGADPTTVDHGSVSRLAEYPRTVTHALAVFPLHHPNFSINFDGSYDFTSYWERHKATRLVYGGSAEFVAGPVPLRLGAYWDGRGPGGRDDKTYIAAGLGYVKAPKLGGAGVDVGVGFRQQLAGPGPLETILSLHLGVRIHPNF